MRRIRHRLEVQTAHKGRVVELSKRCKLINPLIILILLHKERDTRTTPVYRCATPVAVKARLKTCPVKDCICFNYNVLWRIAFLSITMSYEGLDFFQLQFPVKDWIFFNYNALWRIAFLSITMSYEGLHFFKYNMIPKREKWKLESRRRWNMNCTRFQVLL